MRYLPLALVLAGCGLLPPGAPPPAPPIDAASAHLDLVVDAAIARDFERLCSLASGTCEGELQGVEDLAPADRPTVQRGDDGWTSGGVLFVLCGVDARGDRYESEVLVFDAGDRLLAAAAVFWIGTGVHVVPGGVGGVEVGEPASEPSRCP